MHAALPTSTAEKPSRSVRCASSSSSSSARSASFFHEAPCARNAVTRYVSSPSTVWCVMPTIRFPVLSENAGFTPTACTNRRSDAWSAPALPARTTPNARPNEVVRIGSPQCDDLRAAPAPNGRHLSSVTDEVEQFTIDKSERGPYLLCRGSLDDQVLHFDRLVDGRVGPI